MIVQCDKCGSVYDDFNRLTFCPHERFAPSEDARRGLIEQGIDPDTGKRR